MYEKQHDKLFTSMKNSCQKFPIKSALHDKLIRDENQLNFDRFIHPDVQLTIALDEDRKYIR
jgi:hypothetical protein